MTRKGTTMKRSTLLYSAIGTLAAAALLAWAFAPRPVQVEAASASLGRFEAGIDEDGKTRVLDRYVVSAPLSGRLARIALREGDAVKAGGVVATLAPLLAPMLDERALREQVARVDAAQAQVALAAAQAERARVALAQARSELARSEKLAPQGYIAEARLDADRLAEQAAQRELDAAQQQRTVAAYGLELARAALNVVRQGPGTGARAFALRAPVAGRVLRVHQTSEGMVGLGTPLLELGDTARMEIVAELLTTDALRIPPGAAVRIERWGGAGTLDGRVRLVEPGAFTKVSALGVEEQRVKVLIDITSPRAQWAALGDAYRVSVRVVTLALEQALRVPVSAVFPLPADAGQQGMAVFTLEAGRAKLTPVDVGARNGTDAWIKSGLQPGAKVIVYPPIGVADGVRVKERKV